MSKTKDYRKLVRDNIPDMIKEEGKIPLYSSLKEAAQDTKFFHLNQKLQEEFSTYTECVNMEKDQSIKLDALASMATAMQSLIDLYGISKEEFEKVRKAKDIKEGKYEDWVFLEKVIEP